MHGKIGPVSVARCAELLTAGGDKIDRSALSRYCDSHQLKLGKVGREMMVDFETVSDHRAPTIRARLCPVRRDLARP
ncbi:hypothetical protein CSW58_10790 [Caulobacter sp. B11]|uniref:hypothetical protein n=1 Tax=Caulobacter sp. B11 TaxID=2048899 RepID=UPI000C12D1A2|nr:hypothetical protein [Caulobacter sp. B11]PHY12713.1 hypothetical protein CSW58_10790 [Caulobacter sp. B11]